MIIDFNNLKITEGYGSGQSKSSIKVLGLDVSKVTEDGVEKIKCELLLSKYPEGANYLVTSSSNTEPLLTNSPVFYFPSTTDPFIQFNVTIDSDKYKVKGGIVVTKNPALPGVGEMAVGTTFKVYANNPFI